MIIQDDTIDQLLAGRDPTKDLLGPEGLIRELTKRIVERALQAELTDHLGYGKGEAPEAPTGTERVNKFEASWFGVQWMTGVG